MALANEVAIIVTGTIRFGENFHQSCFTITEIINYEDLGFAAPGEGTSS